MSTGVNGYVFSNYVHVTSGGKAPYCKMCAGTDRVRMVRPRRGWGAAGQSYHPAEPWCMKCCKKMSGRYCLVGGPADR